MFPSLTFSLESVRVRVIFQRLWVTWKQEGGFKKKSDTQTIKETADWD